MYPNNELICLSKCNEKLRVTLVVIEDDKNGWVAGVIHQRIEQ